MSKLSYFARNSSKVYLRRSILVFLLLASLSLISVPTVHSAQVTFAWDPSPSTVAGYKLYHGTSDGNYPNSIDAQSATTVAVDLTSPTHYVVAKAYDSTGNESAPSNQVIAHCINSSAGTGGNISPSGTFYASQGSSRTFTITPDAGYRISDVLVNGSSVGAISSYTLSSITEPQTVSAKFSLIPTNYTITASAGTNGSISPTGSVSVAPGGSQSFTVTPNTGYQVSDVLVDGVSVGAVTNYTFSDVTANHSISASFAIKNFTITSSAGSNGAISPSPSATVNYGGSQSFTVTPNTGYQVSDVLVDGVSVGAVTSYTFSDVTANHSISASFTIKRFTITSSAGSNGTISPSPSVTVNYGGSQSFSITPNTGYKVGDVLVDGVSKGAVASYTFSNVESNHSIAASFMQKNQLPVADAGPDQTVSEGVLVTLNASNSTDPEGSPLSYMWTQTGGTQVSLSSQTAAQPTFTAPDVGSSGAALTFQLTVTNHEGLQSSDTCIVNITWINAPPIANAGTDRTVEEGATVTLDGISSTDPDDGIASYVWEQVSGPSVVLALTPDKPSRIVFIAPDVELAGTSLTFQLTVTDNGGLKATDTCVVNVTWVNDPPQANAGSDQSVYGGEVVLLDGSASSDPDDGIKSYLWKQTNGSPVTLASPTESQASFTAPNVDTDTTLTFLLTVTDNGCLQSTANCNVYVKQQVGPDLTGSWASLSYSRSRVYGSFEIKNTGNQKAGAFVTRIYLSNDGSTLGTLIAKSSLSYLYAAQSKKISFKYYAAGLSGKYVIAVVDADNSVAESTEENNRISARIP